MSKIPNALTVIYFDDKDKNIYAELPPDIEQAKRLSKRIYKSEWQPYLPTRKQTSRQPLAANCFSCSL